jgi:hypothetical protein
MALAGKSEHRTVMNKPIDHGGGGHLVRKDLRPFLERQVGRQRNAPTFVTLRD